MNSLGVGALVRHFAESRRDAVAVDLLPVFNGDVRHRTTEPADEVEHEPEDPLQAATERLALLRALRLVLPRDVRDKVWMMTTVERGT